MSASFNSGLGKRNFLSSFLLKDKTQVNMKQKIRQKTGVISPTKMKEYKSFIHTNVVTSDSTIDTLKEEIAKVVLKWLKTKIGGGKGNTINQFVDVSVVNGSAGGDPPETPTTVNIITMVVNCPNSNNNSATSD